MLTDDERQELFALQWYWGAHYLFFLVDGVWTARRLADPAHVIRAGGPGELRDKLRSDYAQVLAANQLAAPVQAEGGSL
jgi:hypothetical protein